MDVCNNVYVFVYVYATFIYVHQFFYVFHYFCLLLKKNFFENVLTLLLALFTLTDSLLYAHPHANVHIRIQIREGVYYICVYSAQYFSAPAYSAYTQ